jgi:TolB-like protein
MKRLLLIVLAICSLGVVVSNAQEIRGITDKLSESLSLSGKKKVAVADFTDLQGNVTELGSYLAEELSDNLSENAKGIEVVDRLTLKAIIQNNKLASAGIIDPATVTKLGQIAGINSLITGTVRPFEDSVHLSVKILDTATANTIGAASADIPKTKAIVELLGQNATSATNRPNPQPQVPSPILVQPSTEIKGIRVVVDNCRGEGERLTCTLKVTSQEQDQKLYLRVGLGDNDLYTNAFDDAGVEYGVDTIQLGGKSSADSYGAVQTLLVAGVPARLVVKFNRFNPSSAQVTLMRFGGIIGYAHEHFELRDIPILRYRHLPDASNPRM